MWNSTRLHTNEGDAGSAERAIVNSDADDADVLDEIGPNATLTLMLSSRGEEQCVRSVKVAKLCRGRTVPEYRSHEINIAQHPDVVAQ
jgi:hypothetical protein